MVYNNLKAICQEKGLTFQEVEQRANLGVGCLSRWKDDNVSPKVKTLKKVAEVIGVSIADLVKE